MRFMVKSAIEIKESVNRHIGRDGGRMLPEAFLKRMQEMLGEEYPAFLESLGRESYHALRLNALKTGADGRSAAEKYGVATTGPESAGTFDVGGPGDGGSGDGRTGDGKAGTGEFGFGRLTKVPWAENGYYYEAEDQPGKHPFHAAGVYYIQEPSAMAPAELLEVQPGERVLDLCAAPGGKSTQIAAKLRGQGFLLCNEIHSARAKILSENIERMGVVNACVTNESPARLAEAFPEYFDRVLVDAPCSGEGMFRRNEAACGEWSPENVRLCAERQDEILDCAAQMLRPGGRLVYSTCTFAPEEDEGSVSRFLQRHPEFEILPIDKKRLGLEGCDGFSACAEAASYGLENTLRMAPHRIRGEGHFAAALRKAGSLTEGLRVNAAGGIIKAVSERELGEFPQFCRDNLRPDKSGSPRYIKFGENIYLIPADMPDLKGLRVLRPGLHMGELKKNRFEPSHALALALSPQTAAHVWNLTASSPEALAYLSGGTFPAEGEKGWYLICVDGFGIGWGKLAGGIMKNHYPKGLRVMGGN